MFKHKLELSKFWYISLNRFLCFYSFLKFSMHISSHLPHEIAKNITCTVFTIKKNIHVIYVFVVHWETVKLFFFFIFEIITSRLQFNWIAPYLMYEIYFCLYAYCLLLLVAVFFEINTFQKQFYKIGQIKAQKIL